MFVKGGASGGGFDEVDVVVGIGFVHRAAEGEFGAEAAFVGGDS